MLIDDTVGNVVGDFEKKIFVRIIYIIAAVYISSVIYLSLWNTLRFVWIMIPIVVLCAITLNTIQALFGDNNVRYTKVVSSEGSISKDEAIYTTSKIAVFSSCFLIVVFFQFTYWIAFYPGGFNLDAYGQWDQVHGVMQLNNWHPVLTTAWYWLLTRVLDELWFCIFVQLILYAVSISFVLVELYSEGVSKAIVVLTAVFVSVNPAVSLNNVCLTKDVLFNVCAIWALWLFMRALSSKGEIMVCKRYTVGVIILVVTMSLTRHNALFFTLPYVIVLSMLYKKSTFKIIIAGVAAIATIMIIEGPVFQEIGIEHHSNITGETVGIPMAAMANAMLKDGDNVPEDAKEYLLNIADENEWKSRYVTGEWDSCKWDFGGTELLQNESLTTILRLFLRTTEKCPDAVYESVRENTRVVWQAVGYSDWNTWVYIEENDYGITKKGNDLFEEIVNLFIKISNTLIGNLFSWNIGFSIIVFIIGALMSVHKGHNRSGLFVIPILSYDFLTMLMLCGASFRYFYFNIVMLLPLTLFIAQTFKNDIGE